MDDGPGADGRHPEKMVTGENPDPDTGANAANVEMLIGTWFVMALMANLLDRSGHMDKEKFQSLLADAEASSGSLLARQMPLRAVRKFIDIIIDDTSGTA